MEGSEHETAQSRQSLIAIEIVIRSRISRDEHDVGSTRRARSQRVVELSVELCTSRWLTRHL